MMSHPFNDRVAINTPSQTEFRFHYVVTIRDRYCRSPMKYPNALLKQLLVYGGLFYFPQVEVVSKLRIFGEVLYHPTTVLTTSTTTTSSCRTRKYTKEGGEVYRTDDGVWFQTNLRLGREQ
jgi:hypothetical protein